MSKLIVFVLFLMVAVCAMATPVTYTFTGYAWPAGQDSIPAGDQITVSLTYASAINPNLIDSQYYQLPTLQSWSMGWLSLTSGETSFGSSVGGSVLSDCAGSVGGCNQGAYALWTNSTGQITGWLIAASNNYDNWVFYANNAGGLGGGSQYDAVKKGISNYSANNNNIPPGDFATWTATSNGATLWTENVPNNPPQTIEAGTALMLGTGLFLISYRGLNIRLRMIMRGARNRIASKGAVQVI